MLSTKLTRQSDIWILTLTGNINSASANLMWSTENGTSLLKEMSQTQVKKLALDLTSVDFIDSHGLRVLLNAHKDFSNENIQIILQNPNSHLKRLLRIMQFDRVFVIEAND